MKDTLNAIETGCDLHRDSCLDGGERFIDFNPFIRMRERREWGLNTNRCSRRVGEGKLKVKISVDCTRCLMKNDHHGSSDGKHTRVIDGVHGREGRNQTSRDRLDSKRTCSDVC